MAFWNVFSGKNKSPQELVAAGEYKTALKGLLAKVTSKKFDPVLMIQIADVYRKMNKMIEAKRYYIRVGEYYGERGFFNKAVAVFKKALNITPGDREILAKLAKYNNKVPKYMLDSQFLRQAGHRFVKAETEESSPASEAVIDPKPNAGNAVSPADADPMDSIEVNFEDIAEPTEEEDFFAEDLTGQGVEDTIQKGAGAFKQDRVTPESSAVFSSRDSDGDPREASDLDFSSLDDALNALFSSEPGIADLSRAENRKHWALFRAMSKDAFLDFVQILESRDFGVEEIIVEQGRHGNEMFLITDGKVEVLLNENRETEQLAVLGEGDFFGEASLLTGAPRNATVRTLSPCSCLVLNQTHLRELNKSHPSVLEAIETSYKARMRQRQLGVEQNP